MKPMLMKQNELHETPHLESNGFVKKKMFVSEGNYRATRYLLRR
jgi:hypothetical protein